MEMSDRIAFVTVKEISRFPNKVY